MPLSPYYGDGADGDVTISSNIDIGKQLKQYNNLTVDNTFVLSGDSPMIIFVNGTLTLTGDISVNTTGEAPTGGAKGGTNAGTGGDGAKAGGILIVHARRIIGTGKLQANGAAASNGTNGSTASDAGNGTNGGVGVAATMEGTSGTAAETGKADGSNVPLATSGGTSVIEELSRHINTNLSNIANTEWSPRSLTTIPGTGAGGGGGRSNNAAGAPPTGASGAGGGGLVADGGTGGANGVNSGNDDGTSGGSGGGGGAGGQVTLAYQSGSAFTIEVKGGAGGNAGAGDTDAGGSGGGGGGGGGLALVFANVFTGTATLTGGTGGTKGTGLGSGGDGDDGGDGSSGLFFKRSLS